MQYSQLLNGSNVPPQFGRFFLAQTLTTDLGPIYNLKWSLDGKYLAAASANGKIFIWRLILSSSDRSQLEVGSSDVFKQDPVVVFEHDSTVNSLDWSRNGFLLSSSDDYTVKLWHIDRIECLHTYKFSGIVTNAQFLKDDDRFFVASQWDGQIFFFSILEKTIIFQKSLGIQITCFDTIGKGENIFVIVGGDKGWLYTLELMKSFEVLTKHQIKQNSTNSPRVTGIESFYDNHSPKINTKHMKVSFKSDLKLIVTANDSKIRLINYSSKNLEVKYSGLENKSSNIKATCSEDHSYILSGSEDGWVYIWNTFHDYKKINTKHINFSDFHDKETATDSKSHKVTQKKKLSSIFKPLSSLPIHSLPFVDDIAQVRNKHYGAWHLFHGRANVVVWGPRSATKLLELSDDPIWELYSMGKHLEKNNVNSIPKVLEDDPQMDDELRSSIIVAADNHGVIKVLRLDFAYEYRKQLNKKSTQKKSSRASARDDTSTYNRTKSKFVSGISSRTRTNSTTTTSTLDTQDNYDYSTNVASTNSILSIGNGTSYPESEAGVLSKLASSYEDNGIIKPVIPIVTVTSAAPDDVIRREHTVKFEGGLNNSHHLLTTAELSSKAQEIDSELQELMARHRLQSGESDGKTAQEDEGDERHKCKRCGSVDFVSRPITVGNTNEINFFCKSCGELDS